MTVAREVALLRGVNVGGHRRVPMADLRDLAGDLGLRDAATFIQSGNLVFTSALKPAAAAAKLEKGIAKRFGFPVDVVVRTAAEWARLAEGNPFKAASAKAPDRVWLLMAKKPPTPGGAEALAARAAAGEEVLQVGDAVWVHIPGGLGTSKLSTALCDRLLGSPTTARNWRTVVAIRGMLEARI